MKKEQNSQENAQNQRSGQKVRDLGRKRSISNSTGKKENQSPRRTAKTDNKNNETSNLKVDHDENQKLFET